MSTILEKLNTDRILSVTAILIGLMTLVVYFVQTRLIIDQQHAGVWPCIEITGTNFGDGSGIKEEFKVNITNKGIGPALIKKVEIKYRGKVYNEFSNVFELATTSNNYSKSSLERRTMASSETVNPIQISLSKEGHKFAQLFYNHDSIQTRTHIALSVN